MRIRFLLLFAALLMMPGCSERTPANLQAAVAYTLQNEPYVQQFDQLLSPAIHHIDGYTSPGNGQRWISESELEPNVTLSMTFEVSIDRTGTQITRISDPVFTVFVSEPIPNGYRSLGDFHIDLDEWKQVVVSGGDVSSIIDEADKRRRESTQP